MINKFILPFGIPIVAIIFILISDNNDRIIIMLHIQAMTQKLPDRWWSSVTMFGHGSVILALLSFAWRKRLDWIIAAFCVTPILSICIVLLKRIISAPRPAAIILDGQLHIIGNPLFSHSFPSGHTAAAFAIAGILLLRKRPSIIASFLIIIIAVGVGLSRIAVGAHWLIDVIAGAGGGWLCAIGGINLMQRSSGLNSRKMQFLYAIIILGSSISLLFINTGYPLGLGVQYISAILGIINSAFWIKFNKPCEKPQPELLGLGGMDSTP